MRLSRPLLGAAACGSALVTLAGTGAASAGDSERAVSLTPLGTYATGTFDEGASEITAYDAGTRRVFVVNAEDGRVDVLDIRTPTAPALVASIPAPGANSVAVHAGLVAIAQEADTKTDPGTVAFYDASTYAARGTVTVGSLPDMVTFTPDGRFALVANEGEPEGYCAGQIDPAGSVSVIDLRGGPAAATARTAGFAAYDSQAAQLRSQGVRIFGPGASVSQDLEPEYIAPAGDGKTAFVTLQENNAIAIVDIATARVSGIRALGLKNHNRSTNGLDPSDRDGGTAIKSWNVRGMYQPDGIAHYAVGGTGYLVTANEGDARDYDCFAEEERVKDLTLDPQAFPNAPAIQADDQLGRLTVTTTAPATERGYTQLQAFGARSVSVRNARTGALVWDSGAGFEWVTGRRAPVLFNANNTENGADNRSDNKGPEPEGVDLGVVGGRTYAFVGLERQSGIVVVDVTDPANGQVVGYASNRNPDGDPEAGTAGDLGPEGILFVPSADSPNGKPLLIVGNEVSGTTTIWQVALG